MNDFEKKEMKRKVKKSRCKIGILNVYTMPRKKERKKKLLTHGQMLGCELYLRCFVQFSNRILFSELKPIYSMSGYLRFQTSKKFHILAVHSWIRHLSTRIRFFILIIRTVYQSTCQCFCILSTKLFMHCILYGCQC